MAIKSDEELKEIIMDTLSYWLSRISGKVITKKKLKELENITNQVMEGQTPNKKNNKQ